MITKTPSPELFHAKEIDWRGPPTLLPESGKAIYTCPMHPEVEQDRPGDCPKCGMTLEPKTVTAGTKEVESAELSDMTRRFWIGAALGVPVFVLAMAHMVPVLGKQRWVNGDVSRWLQFVLATPVVCWAGWPFFKRGWRSVVSRNLNMFTLIALGVGAAFTLSAVAMLLPGLFPSTMHRGGKVGLYFESAAMVTVLVLLGQVLELRARLRTGSAIKALLNLAPPTARKVSQGGRSGCAARYGESRRLSARSPWRQCARRWHDSRGPLHR
jgi:Cu+-exporting ATPase